VPETNTFYIREFEAPKVAAEATRFLSWICRRATDANREIQVVEDALCRFGARLLCPNLDSGDDEAEKLGEILYDGYMQGKITKMELRRMFMTPLPDVEQVHILLKQISSLYQ
jgi:hypothetical protein